MLKSGQTQLNLFIQPGERPVDQVETASCESPLNDSAGLGNHSSGSPAVQSLWLCIRFPQLSLEVAGSPNAVPAAVFTADPGRIFIHACNLLAADAGITPGMSLDSALALLPALDIREHQPALERSILQALANWALGYTSLVRLDIEGVLLLEVGASLNLFGGLYSLRTRLTRELYARGHRVVIASAPLAKAAYWLTRANVPVDCSTKHELFGTLRHLSLASLDWPANVQQKLLQMGVHSLSDCVRLPRDGFARRIGPAYLRDLDQGFGVCPELPSYYRPAELFHADLELPSDTLIANEIAMALESLFARLSTFLRQRQSGAQQVEIRLRHFRCDPTVLTINVSESCTSINHFVELSRLNLERTQLPAPVIAISVRAEPVIFHGERQDDLLHKLAACSVSEKSPQVSYEAVIHFVEQLRARLGPERVHGLHVRADHRPEYAWQMTEPCSVQSDPGSGLFINPMRPLWLLKQPVLLRAYENQPVQHGVTIKLEDAERIESGWWDGRDIRRDYYQGVNPRGVRLWLYRDCRNSAWYLHGLFA